jgi:acetyl-CoA carboxylase biotin carboxyl carrier protein
MTYKEIQDLVKMVVRLELSELKLRDGEFELSVRTKEFSKVKSSAAPSVISMAAPTPTPVSAPAPAAPNSEITDDSGQDAASSLYEIKSPIVGTFYRASSPDKPPFVKVGDVIKSGDVVCVVEAMKLFNEIEAEVSGKIVKVLIEDATPVEYDQTLFLVDPKG